ncbi:MAG: hypothetical protein D6B25_20655 [Desulfobulbaceae bacterium]|nr:MAG: hypothetical protein D6B25_20655 [Desulfobulbaceae bacterium]
MGSEPSGVETFIRTFESFAAQSQNQFTLLILIGLATLISEDLACIAAGLLAAKALISPLGAVAASALGIYIGDILLYGAGYFIGTPALRYPPLSWLISEQAVQNGIRVFEQRGPVIILLSRFLPGTRTATFIGAGLLRYRFMKLLLFFGIAVLLWTPVLVLGTMVVGKQALRYVDVYSSYALLVFVGLLAVLYLFVNLIVPLFTWRGRRLLLGRWRRLTRWEFWPFYVTNIVTIVYVLWLGLFKYRKPTLFTVVNPAIEPDGGFIGESKSAILKCLNQDFVGRWELIDGTISFAEQRESVTAFKKQHNLDFPLVLKPDQGERGKGVGICRSDDEIDRWLMENRDDFIVMEFLEGEEFGIFYYRFPGESSGEIFSITKKKLTAVTGDGIHTLEELILADERAVCQAPLFLRRHTDCLLEIPEGGEKFPLVEVGTHCRGALFLDRAELNTKQLREAVETILSPYHDFFFGRFDVKVPSEAALRAGQQIKVIELNGLTSEATHIYDPIHSPVYGWKILCKQWALAFRIAHENYKMGHMPMKFLSFLSHLSHHLKK